MLIVTHRNSPSSDCPDGKLAALILSIAYPEAQVRMMNHAELDALEPQDDVVFADICPSARRLDEWTSKNCVVVLDHHETARANVARFTNGVFGEAPLSGASLALQHAVEFAPSALSWAAVREIVDLIAIRDTWQRDSPHWERACDASAALLFWPFLVLREALYSYDKTWLEVGPVDRWRHIGQVQEAVTNGVVALVGGYRVRFVQGTHVTSDAADLCDEDIVVGFKCLGYLPNGVVWAFSMRSRKGVDVSAIAAKNGGGGHRAAAGFTLTGIPLSKSPHAAWSEAL